MDEEGELKEKKEVEKEGDSNEEENEIVDGRAKEWALKYHEKVNNDDGMIIGRRLMKEYIEKTGDTNTQRIEDLSDWFNKIQQHPTPTTFHLVTSSFTFIPFLFRFCFRFFFFYCFFFAFFFFFFFF